MVIIHGKKKKEKINLQNVLLGSSNASVEQEVQEEWERVRCQYKMGVLKLDYPPNLVVPTTVTKLQ